MKNKRLIIILSMLAVIITIVILSSTVFTLQTVEIRFYNKNDKIVHISTLNKYNTNKSVQSIIDSGDFKYGQNIFLVDKDSPIKRMEEKKPYVRIITMWIEFPNKLVIKAVERDEIFAIPLENGKYAITDGQLKVLRIADDDYDKYGAIKLDNLAGDNGEKVILGDAKLGKKITPNLRVNIAKNLIPALQRCFLFDADDMEQKNPAILTLFENIELYSDWSYDVPSGELPDTKCTWIKLYTRIRDKNGVAVAGLKIEIEDAAKDLNAKILKALSVYDNILKENNQGFINAGIEPPKRDSGTIRIGFNFATAGAVYIPD